MASKPRPRLTSEQKESICTLLIEGKTQVEIAKALGVDLRAILDERSKDTLFDEAYNRAQNAGFDVQADTLLTMPDEIADVNKARLKSDNLKWILSRRAAARYGDRMTLDVNQTVDIGSALQEARKRTLPNSYPMQEIEAQAIELIEDSKASETDKQSVDEPETRDADKIPEQDIFD